MKGRKIVVFVGPSIDKEAAKEILDIGHDVEYMPPAKRGDVSKAANDGAGIICLIDGVFFQDSAVAHREILYALKKGVTVIGSSSMGALRASELDLYGMEGVGKIYEWYKSGKLISDDEVALFFDPVYFKPLSEPLVNIRYNLRIAEAEGVIDRDACEKVLRIAKSLYFPDRTYQRILDAAEGVIDGDALKRLRSFIEAEKRDIKMEDAIEALKRVRDINEVTE
ncbi:MAG: TfuA-related McrA-glycine thioamidation protein [Candidatus Methanogaster sp.]|uniref:TfuA-related McrA-glycine thioamidation protein n=1 Tax=Candidatus Methanogaster sp. TaxID=3386292 RepID=A0AC61L409_9EURY|nr:MAG: TfuA-related McrA-glycine thioamidation protein [ANME-2 cluster archaeon]